MIVYIHYIIGMIGSDERFQPLSQDDSDWLDYKHGIFLY